MAGTGWRQIGVRTYPTVRVCWPIRQPLKVVLALPLDEEVSGSCTVGSGIATQSGPFPTLPEICSQTGLHRRKAPQAIEAAKGCTTSTHMASGARSRYGFAPKPKFLPLRTGWKGNLLLPPTRGTSTRGTTINGCPAQVRHYTAEQDLLNDTPNDGVLAMAVMILAWFTRDERSVETCQFTHDYRSGGPAEQRQLRVTFIWKIRLASPQSTMVTSGSISAVRRSLLAPSSCTRIIQHRRGTMICDGRAVSRTVYPELYAVVGANVPDLRGQFIRGSNANNDSQGKTRHQDTTRMPRNRFTTNTQGSHKHAGTYGYKADGGGREAFVGHRILGLITTGRGM